MNFIPQLRQHCTKDLGKSISSQNSSGLEGDYFLIKGLSPPVYTTDDDTKTETKFQWDSELTFTGCVTSAPESPATGRCSYASNDADSSDDDDDDVGKKAYAEGGRRLGSGRIQLSEEDLLHSKLVPRKGSASVVVDELDLLTKIAESKHVEVSRQTILAETPGAGIGQSNSNDHMDDLPPTHVQYEFVMTPAMPDMQYFIDVHLC